MSTRKIKDAKDLTTGELIYFKGHAKATYMSDGRTVEEAVSEMSGGDSQPLIQITYNELVELRNNSQLVPGQQYRITDYVTTTTQENTKSVGHAFDVIVMATDNKTLNEVARACLHEGDTYFSEAGANLAAWKVWYCLDNDTTRFAWACEKAISNGDTFFIRTPKSDVVHNGVQYYAWKSISMDTFVAFSMSQSPAINETMYDDTFEEDWEVVEMIHGKGVIYRLIDEWNNDCPYDFKNIQFKRGIYTDGEGIAKEEGDEDYEVFCYTFSWEDETHLVIKDASIFGNNGSLLNDEGQINGVYGNTIKSYINYTGEFEAPRVAQQFLNNIVFLSTFGYEEGLFYGCHGNSFGNDCYSNSFGNSCYSNSFGNSCGYNSFCDSDGETIPYCCNNQFGNYCKNVKLLNNSTASNSSKLQNIRVASGCTGTVEVARGLEYETTIAKNSSGDIKVYCAADLIA